VLLASAQRLGISSPWFGKVFTGFVREKPNVHYPGQRAKCGKHRPLNDLRQYGKFFHEMAHPLHWAAYHSRPASRRLFKTTECVMLVLTRKLQQQIKIGEQITVTILKVKGSTVRIGVQAPREVRVIRGELPKAGANGEAAPEPQPVEVAVALGDEDPAATEAIDEAAGVPPAAAEAEGAVARPASPITATHLPLRRIRNRYGAAPLKQVIASCATLAK
jgi:carbon storage regulator